MVMFWLKIYHGILQRIYYPSLVLVQPRKTRPCLNERLLMGRKESNQTNKTKDLLVTGLNSTSVVSLSKAFHLECLLQVQPRKLPNMTEKLGTETKIIKHQNSISILLLK